MQVGLGAMNRTRDDFWGMSLQEWEAAYTGWSEANGGGDTGDSFSGADLEKLEQRVADQSASIGGQAII